MNSLGELILPVCVLINITLGLAIEAYGSSNGWHWAEAAVGVATLAHLAYYFWRPPLIGGARVERRLLFICLVLATLGELILSSVLGLYTYRVSLLPIFVPPGHVLLFLAGWVLSHQRFCDMRITWLIPGLGCIALIWQGFSGRDFLSIPLLLALIICIYFGREKKLYATMFVLALALELLGTALGSWTWAPLIPSVNLASANPPFAAGSLYAMLDLLTVAVAGTVVSFRNKH